MEKETTRRKKKTGKKWFVDSHFLTTLATDGSIVTYFLFSSTAINKLTDLSRTQCSREEVGRTALAVGI